MLPRNLRNKDNVGLTSMTYIYCYTLFSVVKPTMILIRLRRELPIRKGSSYAELKKKNVCPFAKEVATPY